MSIAYSVSYTETSSPHVLRTVLPYLIGHQPRKDASMRLTLPCREQTAALNIIAGVIGPSKGDVENDQSQQTSSNRGRGYLKPHKCTRHKRR